MLESAYGRLTIALVATIGLFVLGIFVFPDALPIFPALELAVAVCGGSGSTTRERVACCGT